MASLAEYGASVGFGISFAIMAAGIIALALVGAAEIALALVAACRVSRAVALTGFAVQAVAILGFTVAMQPYAVTLMFVLFLAKVILGYRILRT